MFSKKNPILSKLREKEKKFNRVIKEYNENYNSYLSYLNDETNDFWEVKENVDIDPSVGELDVGFTGNITQEKCFDRCAKHKDCKYAIYSENPQSCKLYSEKSSGFTNNGTKIGWEKPTWNDYKDTSFFNSGFTPGRSTASWKYLGQSTSLDDCKNKSINTNKGPFASVVYGDKGEFKNNCYGGTVGGKVRKQSRFGMMTSTAPGGSTSFSVQNQSSFNIDVGSSSNNNKIIELPMPGITVGDTPVNKQSPGWSDTFKATVNGNKLTVTRVDQDSGWGQDLILKGVAPNIEGIQNKIMLKKLLINNDKLNIILDEINYLTDNISEKDKENKKIAMTLQLDLIRKAGELDEQRKKLVSLFNNINTISGKSKFSKLQIIKERYALFGFTVLAILILGLTLKQVIPGSNGEQ